VRGVLVEQAAAPLPLDGPYALHPALAQLKQRHADGELLVVHAVATPYRERSHFDAQQVLESGGTKAHVLDTGWVGRALQAMQPQRAGLALAAATPLALRGAPTVDSWSPSALPDPAPDLLARIERLYAGDAQLAPAFERARLLHAGGDMPGMHRGGMQAAGMRADAMQAAGVQPAGMPTPGAPMPGSPDRPQKAPAFVTLARAAGEFLARPGGPQVAVLELSGWDTHANEAVPQGALARNLALLDDGLAALRTALGAAWAHTAVLAVSEFGRAVAPNGTQGTDHGTAGVAFVLGGCVAGGRVRADWPGVAPAALHEGRDLRPTTDLRAVAKALLGPQLGLSDAHLRAVFPGSDAVAPLKDVLRA
jgi:uncharacterized protein (DUF1501 family)